ncbi:MAG: hypothetical protein LBV20_03650 [Treponema sp.]|jgi:hypothetical protein|nr:hypothetical protein [Treponema sp.]
MQKKMIVALLGLFLAVQVFGAGRTGAAVPQNDQQLVPAGHWMYDSLLMLAFEAGMTSMAVAAPLSIAELRGCLDDVPYDDLSPQGQQEYRRIIDYVNERWLGFSSEIFSLDAGLSINPEAFFKTNAEVDWFYDYPLRSPILSLPIRVSAANLVTVESDLYFGQNYGTVSSHDTFINIPLSDDAFDSQFPKRSSLSLGNSFLNFHVGQGGIDAGHTQTGSLVLSRYMMGATYAQFSLFSPWARFSTNVIEMEVNKYLYLHRLELRPFKRVTISLIEGVMVNAPLELRYLNPAMIYHNLVAWRDYDDYNSGQADGGKFPPQDSHVGSVFGINIDINPWKYIRLYGQFGLNQFQTSFERENYPEASAKIPDSLAFLGGLESWIPLAKIAYLYFGAEAVYTSPWMYIHANKDWSLFRSWVELVSPDPNAVINQWTGSPFGPDSIAAQVKIGWKVPGKYSVYTGWRMWIKGETDFSVFDAASYYPDTTEEATKKSPTGIAVYDNRMFLSADWEALSWLSLGSTVSAGWILNDKHVSGKQEFSAEFALNVKLRCY